MDEFQDAMTLGQRLTDQDILELQILIEQAVHEIKHLRPQVTFYTWQQSKHYIDNKMQTSKPLNACCYL